jgi:capsid protein
MMRLFEASKAVDGQAGLLKIKGGKLQGIEGSRIAKPTTGTFPESIKKATDHGLIMDDYGAVDKFIICRRVNYALEFQSLVNWEDIAYDGYFFRFDQSVGITPFAAAMNTCQDLYEGFDYQLIKTKMHALLGVFITSAATQKASDGFGDVDANTGTAATPETTKYKYELRPGMKLEGKPGDDIKMIESHTPSAEFQQFSDMMIHISLLTFDIPISFFNSIKSNYSQSKFDLKTYEHSCRGKREDNQEILHEIAEWKLKQFHVQDSELAGMLAKRKLRLEDVSYEFVPEGIPWIDEVAEIQAATARIDAALSTRTHECKIHGGRFRDNLRVLKLEEQEIKEAGVTVVRGMPGQSTKPANDPQPVDQNPDNQPKTDPEGNQNAA